MGKSSSGKDTIYKMLLEKKELELQRIVPYTTRPIRIGEKEGVEYHFTDEAGLRRLEDAGKVVELRSYQTVRGIWKYFTVDDGQIRLEAENYLVIGTLEAYQKMKEYFGEQKVCPLYVELENEERMRRAKLREEQQEKPDYAELERRFRADEEDFSEEKIEACGITTRFYNTNSADTVCRVAKYIHGLEIMDMR